MKTKSTPMTKEDGCGFTMIEILIAVAIVLVLIAIAIPVVMKVRERALVAKSANNLRQIFVATQMYAQDNGDRLFSGEAADWFKYGGKFQGNADASFNSETPRVLNRYVQNNLEIFRHPSDTKPLSFTLNSTHYNAYGNDYAFNSIGSPASPNQFLGGFSGVPLSQIRNPSGAVLFVEADMMKTATSKRYDFGWAGGDKGNVCFADGRIDFMDLPSSEDDSPYTWKP